MGKSFWVALCVFGFGLFASVFVTYLIEEYRWQDMVRTMRELNEATQSHERSIDRLAKSLPAAVAQGEKQSNEAKRIEYELLKKRSIDLFSKRLEDPESSWWRELPGSLNLFDYYRKSNLRSLLFTGFALGFSVFVAVVAVKTKKRLSGEVAALARQQSEIDRSNANLVEREQRLKRGQDRLSAESIALEKLREAFDEERRRFWREKKKSQYGKKHEGENTPADNEQVGAVTKNLKLANQSEVPATTLAPWGFWFKTSRNDKGQPLPQKKDEFIKVLGSILEKEGRPKLNMNLVFKRLLLLTKRLDMNQGHDRVRHGKLKRCGKFRIRDHRFLYLRKGYK